MQGDIAREALAEDICGRIKKQMEKYPDTRPAFKELGREVLEEFMSDLPDWAQEYAQLFEEG